ncbi:MAG: glycosyltransferase [Candidatus Methylomirabilis sp.]|nr:glycosyltransferase [Deltaproteobacteria bacterium]
MPEVSVIIGAYNSLPYLKLCIRALERQTFRDFEALIADDGSGPEVGAWFKARRPFFPLRHVWQEKRGFRKCRILNRAVMESRAGYIVFLDADCIVARDFLEVHFRNRRRGEFLGGRRVMMSIPVSERVTAEMVDKGYFDGPTLWGLYHSLKGDFRYYEEALRPLHRLRGSSPFSLLGCNFSMYREDLLSVNGFDEEYEHRGGGEDTDISYRLKAAGCAMRSVRYLAIQFHLGHEKSGSKDISEAMFRDKRAGIRDAADAKRIRSAFNPFLASSTGAHR